MGKETERTGERQRDKEEKEGEDERGVGRRGKGEELLSDVHKRKQNNLPPSRSYE